MVEEARGVYLRGYALPLTEEWSAGKGALTVNEFATALAPSLRAALWQTRHVHTSKVARTKRYRERGLEPTKPELIAYARLGTRLLGGSHGGGAGRKSLPRYLGIDPITDGDLMWIADEARSSFRDVTQLKPGLHDLNARPWRHRSLPSGQNTTTGKTGISATWSEVYAYSSVPCCPSQCGPGLLLQRTDSRKLVDTSARTDAPRRVSPSVVCLTAQTDTFFCDPQPLQSS